MKQTFWERLTSRKFLTMLAAVAALLAKSPNLRHDAATWNQIVVVVVGWILGESIVDHAAVRAAAPDNVTVAVSPLTQNGGTL